jgi:hypothetical protein
LCSHSQYRLIKPNMTQNEIINRNTEIDTLIDVQLLFTIHVWLMQIESSHNIILRLYGSISFFSIMSWILTLKPGRTCQHPYFPTVAPSTLALIRIIFLYLQTYTAHRGTAAIQLRKMAFSTTKTLERAQAKLSIF